MLKDAVCMAIGTICALVTLAFGGWSTALITLVWFMGLDFLLGLIVAGVFKKSKKSKTGKLSSTASWKGLAKKVVTLLFVSFAYRIDLLMNTTFLKDAVTISFIVNEALSICENAGLMGIPIPSVLSKAIEALRKDGENVQ